VESRSSEPDLMLLLNNPVDPVQGRVSAADFREAVALSISQELPFDGKALALAENLGEPVLEKGSAGFPAAISQLARTLSGSRERVEVVSWGSRIRNMLGGR